MSDGNPDYEGVTPESALLATMHRHLVYLREGIMRICHALEHRAVVHDASKYGPLEFPGFARINATARQHAYGSPEYTASLQAEKPTIQHHTASNSHHPEYHDAPADMGWLDIVEMVCDWWSASKTYSTTDWDEVMELQKQRFDWTPEQWWLICQVAEFMAARVLPDDVKAPKTSD